MSMNIENRNLTRRCRGGPILNEADRLRKETFQQLRIKRLLQVRDESRKIARKIRSDISKENDRQLHKLEKVRVQQCQNGLDTKRHDYRASICQIGEAHRAAKFDNQLSTTHKRGAKQTYKKHQTNIDDRKQIKSVKSERNPHVDIKRNFSYKHHTQKAIVPECTEINISNECRNKENSTRGLESNNVCLKPGQEPCECCFESDDSGERQEQPSCNMFIKYSLTDLSDGSLCESEAKLTKSTQTSLKETPLSRTPAVVLDVEVDSDDDVSMVLPNEVSDRHIEHNRQFSHVIRVSPKKSKKPWQAVDVFENKLQNEKANISVKDRQTSTLAKVTPKKKNSYVSIASPMRKMKERSLIKCAGPKIMGGTKCHSATKKSDKVGKPRFTQISDILQKNKTELPSETVIKNISPTLITAQKGPQSVKSADTINVHKTSSHCESGGSERVQFYDYNNKFTKQYPQPLVTVRAEHDQTQPTAMEQANVEKELAKAKHKESEQLRKNSDVRGQKAIEREQVRRDCNELTKKLDALTQQHSDLLPTDEYLQPSYRFANRAVFLQQKMNSAIEEILLRPAVVTCADIDSRKKETQSNVHKIISDENTVNIGAAPVIDHLNSEKSDSCCSILLGYVNDQGKQIRDELSQCETQPFQNQHKIEKLTNLLYRVDTIRNLLMEEMKGERAHLPDATNVRSVIDTISKVRKDRVKILCDEIAQNTKLEKKCSQKYEQSGGSKTSPQKRRNIQDITVSQSLNGEDRNKMDSGKPFEIIIRFKSESKSVTKSPRKTPLKETSSPNISNTEDVKLTEVKSIDEKKNRVDRTLLTDSIYAQESYDSNSTSYRSLPSKLIDNIHSNTTEVPCVETKQKSEKSITHLNPLIVHYVNSLLKMSKQSVLDLDVSSSDIKTPASSIVNVSKNFSSYDEQNLTKDRLNRVEKFVNEHHSFINDLEETLRSHNKMSLETSRKAFDEIWRNKITNGNKILRHPSQVGSGDELQTLPETEVTKSGSLREKPHVEKRISSKRISFVGVRHKTTARQPKQENVNTDSVKSTMSGIPTDTSKRNVSSSENNIGIASSNFEGNNQRIAQLDEMISKVREEKIRLLEATLSSVSELATKSSSDYLDLPEGERKSVEKTTSEVSPETLGLEKNKVIGISRDSGISMSRPITAEEQLQEMQPTLVPLTSELGKVCEHKAKVPPPSVLRRYSPQFLEDEVIHELSTIVEVDTPVTSRINSSIQQHHSRISSSISHFPSFQQYIQELNLDITQLDPEQSILIQQQFNELVSKLREGYLSKELCHKEFPTLNDFLHNLTSQNVNDVDCTANDKTPETIDDIITKLRLANLVIESFPTQKDYIRKKANASDGIDTESLENITESRKNETDSETIDIEEELKRRNILKKQFLTTSKGSEAQKVDNYKSEEQISTSDNFSVDLERELLDIGIKWPTSIRPKTHALSTTSSSLSQALPSKRNYMKVHSPKESTDLNLNDTGRPLNLRDFLTKELLKHTNSTSTSSNDESLRNQFLHSIIDSITSSASHEYRLGQAECAFMSSERNQQYSSNDCGTNLDRLKTSTPVYSQSTRKGSWGGVNGSSSSSSHLFSGESRLSSVHYQKR